MNSDIIASPGNTIRFYSEGYDSRTSKYYVILQVPTVHGNTELVAILSEEIAHSESVLFKRLAQRGYSVPTTARSRRDILVSIEAQRIEHSKQRKPIQEVSEQIGWLNNKFTQYMIPNKVYGDEASSVHLTVGSLIPHMFEKKGTLNQWREHVAVNFDKNSILTFAATIPFAAPLLKILGKESCGFSLVGPSSIGKTTCLKVCASVTGKGMSTWNSTLNALSRKAIAYNDTILVIDETGQAQDENMILSAAYHLAGGQGKDRLTDKDSNYNWRIFYLSSSEKTLDELPKGPRTRVMDGQRARM